MRCLELNDGIAIGSSDRISGESIEPFNSLWINAKLIKRRLLVKEFKIGLVPQRYSAKLKNLFWIRLSRSMLVCWWGSQINYSNSRIEQTREV